MFSTFKILNTSGDVNILRFSSLSLPLHPKLSPSLLLITTTCQPLPLLWRLAVVKATAVVRLAQ